MRRLYFRIYLAVLGSLALFAILVGLSGWVFHELREPDNTGPQSPFISDAVEHLLPANASPAALARELEFWHNRTKFDLALLSAGGEVIARAGTVPENALARFARRPATAKGVHWHPHGPLTVRLDAGRQLVAFPPPSASRFLFPLRWLGIVFAIGLAVAIAAYPLVRRLTRNLERLQKGVAAFGQGDLQARVAVRGRDEVAKLAETFNASASRIEALVNAQKRLLANASHELRSPLARLRMAAEAIGGASPGQREEIARNIAELDGLVDEILLASRLDAVAAGASQRQPIDLAGLLAEECAALDADLSVVPGQSLFVEGDARLLHRLFRNLLENARRHGGGGAIEVSAECRGSRAAVMVCDNGPGIPEAERARIFEPFYRLPGHSEHAGGTGLGLALVRQIAEKHEGQVRYVPREGGGACFEVTLPLGPSGFDPASRDTGHR